MITRNISRPWVGVSGSVEPPTRMQCAILLVHPHTCTRAARGIVRVDEQAKWRTRRRASESELTATNVRLNGSAQADPAAAGRGRQPGSARPTARPTAAGDELQPRGEPLVLTRNLCAARSVLASYGQQRMRGHGPLFRGTQCDHKEASPSNKRRPFCERIARNSAARRGDMCPLASAGGRSPFN